MAMIVNEIFESLQGESSYAGLPCIFVRLTGCNLRCKWCDTKYAYEDGKEIQCSEIVRLINSSKTEIIEFTGGEPLLQKDELTKVISGIDSSKTILLETNGSMSLKGIPERVVKIADIKLKGSGEGGSFLKDNLGFIKKTDEIKFVLSGKNDYDEMKDYLLRYNLEEKYSVLVSRVKNAELTDREIADMILKDGLKVRYQIQIHKIIWGEERGK